MSAARQVVGIPMPAGSAPSPPLSRGASKGKGSFFVFHSFGVVRMPRGDRWAKKYCEPEGPPPPASKSRDWLVRGQGGCE
ncbi:hypothetical protein TNIN_296431 [Trichonephila inaurata madagascariensis]|uniref:Uncharacterized protein n=1 Tax=Trichonephila inaurata madagascariensis TaxID=2747483 RepID=A0A8X6IWB4_9ARAC|nr:hypothetical protein TNIN_296431 [Trichonephila inaurata madagascariensis]